MLSALQINDDGLLQVKDPVLSESLAKLLEERANYKERLLSVEFVTV